MMFAQRRYAGDLLLLTLFAARPALTGDNITRAYLLDQQNL